jgi:hypothetical protein
MRKRSPRKQPPQNEPTSDATAESVQTPAPTRPKAQPITVKKQEPLPPDAVRERKKFYEDSADIEEGIWRSIYG